MYVITVIWLPDCNSKGARKPFHDICRHLQSETICLDEIQID